MEGAVDTRDIMDAVVRLRRIELCGGDVATAIGDVRARLQEVIGPTVRRALVARMAGVSQTALERHIAAGRIPVVITPSGRREIPTDEAVRLLVDLGKMNEHDDATRRPLSALLRRREHLARAILKSTGVETWAREAQHRSDPSALRATALHRLIAARLEPSTVDSARRRLERWSADGRIDHRWADAWRALLDGPLPRLRERLASDEPGDIDMRQSSPFAGEVPDELRRALLATLSDTEK